MSKYWEIKNRIDELVKNKKDIIRENNEEEIKALKKAYFRKYNIEREMTDFLKWSEISLDAQKEMERLKAIIGRKLNKVLYSNWEKEMEDEIISAMSKVKELEALAEDLYFKLTLASGGKAATAIVNEFMVKLEKIK